LERPCVMLFLLRFLRFRFACSDLIPSFDYGSFGVRSVHLLLLLGLARLLLLRLRCATRWQRCVADVCTVVRNPRLFALLAVVLELFVVTVVNILILIIPILRIVERSRRAAL